MREVFSASNLPDQLIGNCVVWGKNTEALSWLPTNEVQFVYLDPPFFAKRDFSTKVAHEGEELEVKVFSDRWQGGEDEYYSHLKEVLSLCRERMAQSGSLFLHCDYRTSARSRLLAESIFGSENYINEIIWFYKTGGVSSKLGFGKKHDSIHFFAKDRAKCKWIPQKEKSYLSHKYGFSNIKIESDSRGDYTTVNARDVFDIPALRGNQPERVPFPTQKPKALIERMMFATTEPGDLVLDPYSGSGTTAVAAAESSRRFVAIDCNYFSISTLKARLRDYEFSEIELKTPLFESDSLLPIQSWSILKKTGENLKEVLFSTEEPNISQGFDASHYITVNDYSGARVRKCLKYWPQ